MTTSITFTKKWQNLQMVLNSHFTAFGKPAILRGNKIHFCKPFVIIDIKCSNPELEFMKSSHIFQHLEIEANG